MKVIESLYRALSSISSTHKMVLVVRQDLGMSKGKMAAQCAHAAVGAFKQSAGGKAASLWELSGQPKVVVKCRDEHELLDLFTKAKAVGLPVALIRDAGKTQLKAGEHTVLGIGPGRSDKIDLLTGRLKLM